LRIRCGTSTPSIGACCCPWRHWQQNATVLDAGCGTGGLIKALQGVGAPWTIKGLDYSPVACSYARERTSVPIAEGSIEALPFGEAQFDAVLSADVICQIDDASVALAEFRRVLKPGGILAINVAAYNWMRSYHDLISNKTPQTGAGSLAAVCCRCRQ